MAIHIPDGTKEFQEAVERLLTAKGKRTIEMEELVNECCRLCKSKGSPDVCDTKCVVYKMGESHDTYKENVNRGGSGMYSTGVYRDPKTGKYSYAHRYQGG